jgi:hypothetical protein
MADSTTTARIRLALEGASSVEQGLAKVQGKVSDVGKTMLGLAGGITAAGFAAWVKGAIDAADQADELAQKTGLLVEQVAGLKLLFEREGLGEQFSQTMAKLSKGASEGNKAFAAMGITVLNEQGRLKDTRQLLGEVAEKFSSYRDGTEKTTLAMELFGKSGAELIPLLNNGAAGIEEMDARARELGLTLSKETAAAAAQFNDNLFILKNYAGSAGVSIANTLLPSLVDLSNAFLTASRYGGGLLGTLRLFGTTTYSINGFNLGKDLEAARSELDKLGKKREEIVRNAAARPLVIANGATKGVDEDIADARRRLEYLKDLERQSVKLSAADQSLSEARRLGLKTLNEYAPVIASATKATKAKAGADKEAESNAKDLYEVMSKAVALTAKASEQYVRDADAIMEGNESLREEIALIGLSTSERAALIEAKERQIIADKELLLVSLQNAGADEVTLANLQREIELRRQRVGLLGDKSVAEASADRAQDEQRAAEDAIKAAQDAAQAQADAYIAAWQDVDAAAADVFMDLAENGEDAFKRIGESIKREVIQMLYEMTIKQWLIQVSGVSGGAMGGGSGGYIDLAMKAYNAYSGAGSAAASSYAGYAAAGGSYAAGAVGDAAVVSYGSSAAAGSSAAGGASAIYGYMGYAALIAAAVMVAENLYEKGYNRAAVGVGSGSTTTFGYSSYTSDPNMGASTAYNVGIENFTRGLYDWIGISEKWSDILSGTVRFAHMFGGKLNGVGLEADIANGSASVSGYAEYDGGLFRSDKTVGIDVDPRDAAALDAQVEAVISGTKMMARAMGLSEEAINAYTGSLQVNFKGADTAQEQAERLATAMADLRYSLLKAASGGQLAREEFERMTAEALAAAESAGISAQSISDVLVNGMMNRLGGPETGAQMADLIAGGIIQSLAQNYTAQVAQMFMSQIITPVFTAMMAGVPISQAISQASIDSMVTYAQNAAAALNAMLNSEEMRAAIGAIGQAAASVGESFGSIVLPSFGGTYELAAATAAVDEAAQAAAEAEAERYSIETELLTLLGKTTELRARELAEIDASNQALQLQVWALEDSRTALDSAFDALQRAMDAENERIEEQLQAASDSESTLRDIFDTLGDSISSLQGEVTATTLMQAETARALLRDAINTGILPEAESLADWIDAATGGLSAVRYTSAVEQDLATLRLSAELQALQDIAEPQLSAAEEAVVVLEAQLEANELLLQTAQEQYEVAVGTYEATVSVVDGINGLHTAMAEYSALIAAGNASVIDFLSAPPEAYSGGSSGGGYSGGGSSGGSSSSGSWTAEGYWSKNPDLQAEFARANLASSPDFNQDPALSAELEYATWHWNTFGKNEGRKFAMGGYTGPGGLYEPAGIVHKGEVVWSQSDVSRAGGVGSVERMRLGGGDDETKALLRQLISEIQAARAGELFSIAKSAARTSAAIDRVSGKGNSIAVRTLEGETVVTEVAP